MNDSVKYAGFWVRFGAYLIDGVIFLIIFGIPSFLLIGGDPAANTAIRLFIGTLSALYVILMPTTKWQGTIGKKLLGLKIVDENGGRLTAGRAVLRYIGQIISALVLYIGFIMAAFTNRKRALHDMMAHTYVVKSRTESYPEPVNRQVNI
ncbi:RDD family protein [Bacillus sp. FJAT-42376]|uniref:RDD family protein n=1 Tax=Bacillus sp. FJAT-42376 TaxID=2014076 RepID=UPI000F504C73|nr:RDD family protein [Bacillus sp. FJAT-42376]AZB41576.1 RDD family protein [Bacillus sp. FJAT-42376]